MPSKSQVPLKKVTINLPVPVLDRVDKYALSLGVPRSSALVFLVSKALEDNERLTVTQEANMNLQQIMSNPMLLAEMLKSKQVNG